MGLWEGGFPSASHPPGDSAVPIQRLGTTVFIPRTEPPPHPPSQAEQDALVEEVATLRLAGAALGPPRVPPGALPGRGGGTSAAASNRLQWGSEAGFGGGKPPCSFQPHPMLGASAPPKLMLKWATFHSFWHIFFELHAYAGRTLILTNNFDTILLM